MVMLDSLKLRSTIGARVKTSAGRAGVVTFLESLEADPMVRVRFDEQVEGEAKEVVARLSQFTVTRSSVLRKGA